MTQTRSSPHLNLRPTRLETPGESSTVEHGSHDGRAVGESRTAVRAGLE